ncbi:MAG: hypothetical protein ABIA21_02590 [Candidatus Aenigmatarchaeota archaeon]
MAARRRIANVKAAPRRKCNPALLIIVLILGTLGIYALLNGFIMHFNGIADTLNILAWYLGGVLALMLAKLSALKSCGCCR